MYSVKDNDGLRWGKASIVKRFSLGGGGRQEVKELFFPWQ